MEEGGEIQKEPTAETGNQPVTEPENPITSKKSVGGAMPIVGGLMHLWSQIFGGGGDIDNPNKINPELGEPATPISRDVQEGINNPAEAITKRDAASTATATSKIDIAATNTAIDEQMKKNREDTTKDQLASSDERRNNMLKEMGVEPNKTTPTPTPKVP